MNSFQETVEETMLRNHFKTVYLNWAKKMMFHDDKWLSTMFTD